MADKKKARKQAKPGPKMPAKISNKIYEKEMDRLQIELVKLQEWIKHKGLKVVVIFEGRDAAGKGGCDKADNRAYQSTYLSSRRFGNPDGTGENAMVFPALCPSSASCRRDGVVRPQLV